MKRIRLLTLTVMLAMVPVTAQAGDATQVAPPFEHASVSHGCVRVVPGDVVVPGCTSAATASVDGALTFDVEARSPADGQIPGPAGGSAWTTLSVAHNLPTVEARALLYSITLHVDRAAAAAAAGPLGSEGFARALATTYVSSPAGGEGASVDIVASDGVNAPATVDDAEITLSVLIGDGVRRTYSGLTEIWIDVQGWANTTQVSLNPQGGVVGISMDARVTGVAYEIIP